MAPRTSAPRAQLSNIVLTLASRHRVLRAAAFTPSIRNATKVQWGLPVLLWGPPGGGKTSELRALARDCHGECYIFSPGEQGEGGIGAVPVPMGDGYISYPAPGWSRPFFTDGGYGFLGLDELTTADARMQPAMLAAALERTIGGRALGGRVRVFAAANDVSDAPGGMDLSPPLANRFIHLTFTDPTVDEFVDYMTTANGTDPEPPPPFDALAEEARVLAAWPNAWANATAAVGGFLKASPGMLRNQPSAGDAAFGHAWASPRSWDMATRCVAAAEIHGLTDEERHALIGGCVSMPLAGEFLTYLREMDLPAAADVLSGKVQWSLENRLDRTLAVLRGITTLVIQTPRTSEGFETLVGRWWRVMENTAKVRADLASPYVKAGLRARLHADAKFPSFIPASGTTVDILGKAKLL